MHEVVYQTNSAVILARSLFASPTQLTRKGEVLFTGRKVVLGKGLEVLVSSETEKPNIIFPNPYLDKITPVTQKN